MVKPSEYPLTVGWVTLCTFLVLAPLGVAAVVAAVSAGVLVALGLHR